MLLFLGSVGPEVVRWQKLIGVTPADGEFGSLTDTVTKEWQSNHGIEPDGVVGPLTIREAGVLAVESYPKAPENLPKPSGVKPMKNPVSKQVTEWASKLLKDVNGHPMGSSDTQEFGGRFILARIEWHTWTHRGGKLVTGIFRGVTLYEYG